MSNPTAQLSPDGDKPQKFPPLPNSEDLSSESRLHVPRIHTSLVFVWLGLTVVLLGADYAMSEIANSAVHKLLKIVIQLPWWTRLIRMFFIAGFAATLVGSWVLIRLHCFKMLGKLQPGHWLVLILALQGIMNCLAKPFESAAIASLPQRGWGSFIVSITAWITIIAVGTSFVIVAVRLRDATRWKVLLAFCAANVFQAAVLLIRMDYSMVMLGNQIYPVFLMCWQPLLLLVAITTIVRDRPRFSTRDWLHWLGVAIWTLSILAIILTMLASFLYVRRSPSERKNTASNKQSQSELSPPRLQGPPHQRLKWKAEEFFSDQGVLALCKAIEEKSLDEIDRLVISGVDVNTKGRGNMTPLLWAFPMGEDVFKKMLEHGADPNVQLTERIKPMALNKGRSVMSASVELADGLIHNLYFYDVPMDNYLKLVLKHGGNPNLKNSYGEPLIFYAMNCKDRAGKVRTLVDGGCDINCRNHSGATPVMNASFQKYRLALLECGADYRMVNNNGWDLILQLERKYKTPQGSRGLVITEWDIARVQPVFEWLTKEGVNWEAAHAALESTEIMNNLKNIPADYKHRPWYPQRPTLKRNK